MNPIFSIRRPGISKAGSISQRSRTLRSAVELGASVDLTRNEQITDVLTADMVEGRLKQLKDNEKYDYESICNEFAKMKAANQIKLWDSVSPSFRRVSLGEVRMLTRGVIKDGTIDVTGEDDMQTLNFSFYSTLISSMTLSLLAGCSIPDIDLPFMYGWFSHLGR